MKKIERLIILFVIVIALTGCDFKKDDIIDNSQDPIVSDENTPENLVIINSIELSPDDYGIKINVNITDFDENNQYGICYINENIDEINLNTQDIFNIEINSYDIINSSYTVSIKYITFYTSKISLNAYCINSDTTYYSDVSSISMLDLAKSSSSEYANKIVSDCNNNEATMNIVTVTINSSDYTFENNSEYYNVSYSPDKNFDKNIVLLTMNEGYNIGANVTLHEIDNSKDENLNQFITTKSGTINGKKFNITIEDNVLTYTFEDRNWSPFY